jgi:hypothetical protein
MDKKRLIAVAGDNDDYMVKSEWSVTTPTRGHDK